MRTRGDMRSLRSLALLSVLSLAPFASGCAGDDIGSGSEDITDVNHTDVERQSIGNCWLYAEASWVESMNLSATGQPFDISQSYWTYWHWFDQIVGGSGGSEIRTGGFYTVANDIILERGIVQEGLFVAEDEISEMSSRQSSALDKMNRELKDGRLKSYQARRDGKLVRQVMDEAWGLTDEVRAELTQVFGEDGSATLDGGATADGTNIIAATAFPARYSERTTDPDNATVVDGTLDQAIASWRVANYPSWGYDLETDRRNFQIRVQRALHDAQPVIITWDVDFNAMENDPESELLGSFNLTTLANSGAPGRQGGHMTVLEDYEAETEEFGLLEAGVTLDPVADADKLDALLLPSTRIKFLRIKNSWGSLRPDRGFAPGMPGYHDLFMDYLNGPINWCPDMESGKTNENCSSTTVPLSSVVLPPGY